MRLGTAWTEAVEGTVLGDIEVSAGSMELRVLHGAGATSAYDVVRQGGLDLPLRPFRKVVDVESVTGHVFGGQPVASLGLKPQQGLSYRRDLRMRMVESIASTRIAQAIDEPEARVNRPIVLSKRRAEVSEDTPSTKRQRTRVSSHCCTFSSHFRRWTIRTSEPPSSASSPRHRPSH